MNHIFNYYKSIHQVNNRYSGKIKYHSGIFCNYPTKINDHFKNLLIHF